MTMKELTAVKHKEAENTLFFKSLITKKMTGKIWINFLFNKMLFLSEIENRLDVKNFYGLFREEKLKNDIYNTEVRDLQIKTSTVNYVKYIKTLDERKLFSHVYVWYMGDLNGGKIIKKMIDCENSNLEFEHPEVLKEKIMNNVDISMIDEINNCFDWAIKILKEFDKDILQESN